MTLLIHGMNGLGDNLHQRPFVRAAAEREDVYLATPWPQLYRDLPMVKCVPSQTKLRTQAKNVARSEYQYQAPRGVRELKLSYGSRTMLSGSLHDALESLLPLGAGQAYVHDAPRFGPSPIESDAPYAVVRPVTVRQEWSAAARNCEPSYIGQAAQALQAAGYRVVSVADLEPGKEWLLGQAPPADVRFHAGELEIERLMALIENAAVVVSPVGFAVHAAVAYRTPVICIAGGRGGHCAPWKETDARQDLRNLRWMMPDRYCMCDVQNHACSKTITDFATRFRRVLSSLIPKERRAAA